MKDISITKSDTDGEPWHGLFLFRDGMANLTRIRGDEHAKERASARVKKGDVEGQVALVTTLFGVVA